MGVSHKADDAVAREMGQLTDKLYAATEKMERDLSKIPADAKKAMAYSHDHLIPDMEKARELADRLGISRSYISRIEKKALLKLKKLLEDAKL